MLTVQEIITIFVIFQLGNLGHWLVVRHTETTLVSLFFTGVFTVLLCVSAVTKGS